MKLKVLAIFLCYGAICLQASQNSSSNRFPLSPEVLQARKEQQAMIAHSIPKKIEVGMIDTVYSHIDQVFIYGQVYKSIGLREFFEKHEHVVTHFKEFVPELCFLDDETEININEQLQENPEQRDIDSYSFVGPELPTLNDDLFNVTKAKKIVLRQVKQYIDDNYQDVYRECYGMQSAQNNSKKVFRVPCCNKQFHESCLIASKAHKINACPNAECQIAENGKHYSKTWDAAFYDKIFMKRALPRKEIAHDTCSLCEETLKEKLSGSVLSTIRDRPYVNNFRSSKKRK